MKVTTIDGGFRGLRGTRTRGLSALSTTHQLAQGEWFNRHLERFARTRSRFRAAVAAGSIPQSDVLAIETGLRATDDLISTHLDRLAQIKNEAGIAPWRAAAATIISGANAIALRAELIVGDERASQPWKIGLTLAGGIASVGLLAWWFTRS